VSELRDMACVPIDVDEPRYRGPMERDAQRLADAIGAQGEVVLLGSIATPKYVDVLRAILGPRLRFPRGIRWARGHEPRRADAAARASARGADLHPDRRRDATRAAAAEAKADEEMEEPVARDTGTARGGAALCLAEGVTRFALSPAMQ
jgi:hypothetical protein